MSPNTLNLLTIAAELRSGGMPWEGVASRLHRKMNTCAKWPSRHRREWDRLYREAQQKRYEDAGNEGLTFLRNWMRGKDPRWSLKAIEVLFKCGPKPNPVEQQPIPKTPMEESIQRMARLAPVERERMDRVRAHEGKPPLTDAEFWDQWRAELREILDEPESTQAEEGSASATSALASDNDAYVAELYDEFQQSAQAEQEPRDAQQERDRRPDPPPDAYAEPPRDANGRGFIVMSALIIALVILNTMLAMRGAGGSPAIVRGTGGPPVVPYAGEPPAPRIVRGTGGPPVVDAQQILIRARTTDRDELRALSFQPDFLIEDLDFHLAKLNRRAVVLQADEALARALGELGARIHIGLGYFLAVIDDGNLICLTGYLKRVPGIDAFIDGFGARHESINRTAVLIRLELPLVLGGVVVEDLNLHAGLAGRLAFRDAGDAEEDAAVAAFLKPPFDAKNEIAVLLVGADPAAAGLAGEDAFLDRPGVLDVPLRLLQFPAGQVLLVEKRHEIGLVVRVSKRDSDKHCEKRTHEKSPQKVANRIESSGGMVRPTMPAVEGQSPIRAFWLCRPACRMKHSGERAMPNLHLVNAVLPGMSVGARDLMDAHTLELLEFDKVRGLLAEYAATSLGRELALQVEPIADAEKIRAEIALVSEMVEALNGGQSPPFGGVHDVRLVVRRAAIGTMLAAEQLLQVADTLTATGAFYRYRMRLEGRFHRLIDLLMPVEDLGPIAKNITGCIDGRGHLIDSASPELAAVRHKLAELEEKVQNEIKRLLRDPKLREILRYPNATVSGDHYVLPVAANHRQKITGVVHRTSSTGETIFVEPASIANLSAERTLLKAEEDRESRRILRKLSAEVGKVSRQVNSALDVIARVDLIAANAKFSNDYRMAAPDVNAEGRLWLRQARHPLLEHLFKNDPSSPPKAVVPIEVRLGVGFNMLVITGPNTGGKTVALKTTGLLALMAQSGMHIPAGEGSAVPVFEQIFADIGDEQSLEQSLSTFSSHISRIASILQSVNANSLVLLDELGAGTDPTEGAALGRAILDHLDKSGCRAMVTTHLGDLKTYAFSNERAENGAVEFDVETLRPTYRLHIGQFGMSNALKIARRLKLPKELLKRAHRYLKRRKGRAPELARLQQLREEAEKARAEALAAQHEAARQREEYEKKLSQLKQEAESEKALRDWRQKLQLNDMVWSPKFGKMAKVVRVDHRKGTLFISVGIGQWEVPSEEVLPEAPK